MNKFFKLEKWLSEECLGKWAVSKRGEAINCELEMGGLLSVWREMSQTHISANTNMSNPKFCLVLATRNNQIIQ